MSFALPLRSLGRSGCGGRFLKPGLGAQLGARPFSRQASFQAGLRASPTHRGFAWAGPVAILAGFGLSAFCSQPLHLETTLPTRSGNGPGTSAPFSSASSDSGVPHHPDMPKSDVNVYNLGFGTVCGICSGIFIKKGAKLIAFLLGGGFVLLQYLNTQRIVTINWRSLTSRYDSAISKAAGEDGVSINKPASGWSDSTAARIWNRSIHFLTADFPSRGTFVAGLLLGLRLG